MVRRAGCEYTKWSKAIVLYPDLFEDIYYDDEYLKLYVHNDDELFSFEYSENKNKFINKSIKRPIRKIGDIEADDGFYDLEGAYGYGGFYANTDDSSFIKKAMEKYELRCREENIISEFIRFHPFNTFLDKHPMLFDFKIRDREVVVLDLGQDIISSYKKKVRSVVKKSLMDVDVLESGNIEKFIELYEGTMLKNKADSFYYFNKCFFDNLLNLNQVKLFEVKYGGDIIAMAFFLFGKDIAHYHLSANSSESYRLNSNYALLHSLFEIAKKNNKKYFMLGGGSTAGADDSLLAFKTKFSSQTKAFHIAGKIYNQKIYDMYCEMWNSQSDSDVKYFLKYRLDVC